MVAAAIAARTLAFSSSVIKRPAFAAAADGNLGSSASKVDLELPFDTEVESVVPRALSAPSGVRKRVNAALRSFIYVNYCTILIDSGRVAHLVSYSLEIEDSESR